ncbi:MAG TPA: prolyl oligopeptidase family serine peptidase [Ilumatobacteraceae bacterium]|nr:prolyl oligopeptidase family serine peptidase [Ilumatobacteraceae bacterium]HRA83991.1 prolyl oligopeptidase family serine peptidase [Ilumatobacteraceae bacterium]HRC47094.1 prolyl oligopeptidase family serine peptidase [Ilumatobacteraceae bacterium]
MSDTFPRQYARTQRLTLGDPRTITVAADGQRVLFARSRAGDDPVNCLWVLDIATGEERLVADPLHLLDAADDEHLPIEERLRRERMREGAGGITSYATDAASTVAAFALGGHLFVAGLLSGQARELVVDGPVFDPRPDPVATCVAYVCGRTLRIAELDGSSWELAGDEHPDISWGSADFIAAEEMGRYRGYWWSPDGAAIAATRADIGPVQRWYISDPANPDQQANEVAYPAAGTPNADVTLHVLALDGGSTEVVWDRDTYPYLADVQWADSQRLLLTVQSRDQRSLMVLAADPRHGGTEPIFADGDTAWVELVPGTPAVLDDGQLVMTADRDGARRLMVDGNAVTPIDLQVRAVVTAQDDEVYFLANPIADATVQHVWRWRTDGTLAALTDEPGVHTAAIGGSTVVLRTAVLDEPGATTQVVDGPTISTFAQQPLVTPNLSLHRYGDRALATAVLLPSHRTAGDDGPLLPVLLDPYGGPHAQRVLRSHNAYLTSQWFADQGFAVVVIDGRGTPGRGSEWERSVQRDLATGPLDDQVAALAAAAQEHPLDLTRVAIRGWSFGGYLAALAVLRRPDVFHAAIAGAPVTEWRLYDTHYTERYLGDPSSDATAYAANSLLPLAGELSRPLLLVHGLADDNVVAAHTLQLSSALLSAGKPHEVLPLVGVTHMTPQEVVAENLLLHQLDFLQRSLGLRDAH